MDKEILDMIKAKLLEVKVTLEGSIDELDVDTIDSPSTGKTIAPDFDDIDLTNIQAAADNGASMLQDLSAEIAGFLMG